MCNIAGYVGDRPAAPILMELIRKQEGLAGGFYTGIATIHNGKIHYAKLTGDLDCLLSFTEAAKLPGNIGIIHSRSNSGGGDAYAHPFVGGVHGAVRTAYIANGSTGRFADRLKQSAVIAQQLLAQGYEMPSRTTVPNHRYPTLSDGSVVHMSDLMCQLITAKTDEGLSPDRAMAEAFCRLPSEIVGLLLSLDQPDCIAWARVNFPLSVAFAPHGAYLSSTPMAFPADAGSAQWMPALTAGRVYRDRFTLAPIVGFPAKVAQTDVGTLARGYALAEKMLCAEISCGQLRKALSELMDTDDLRCGLQFCYEILDAFAKEGRLQQRVLQVEGTAQGLTAPKFVYKLKGKKDETAV
ncbi:MAG: hypothetical protein IJN42_00195 [Clostridia bacterium]|nr:hypothetical protein [Clostridia bacterium]